MSSDDPKDALAKPDLRTFLKHTRLEVDGVTYDGPLRILDAIEAKQAEAGSFTLAPITFRRGGPPVVFERFPCESASTRVNSEPDDALKPLVIDASEVPAHLLRAERAREPFIVIIDDTYRFPLSKFHELGSPRFAEERLARMRTALENLSFNRAFESMGLTLENAAHGLRDLATSLRLLPELPEQLEGDVNEWGVPTFRARLLRVAILAAYARP